MKIIVKSNENILRVYKMPPEDQLPHDFCFAGGHQITFVMVDWFNVIPPSITEGSKDYLPSLIVHTDGTREVDEEDIKAVLIPFIREKVYYRDDRTFLCISKSGWCFTV